ncbi:SRPBCC family protein [Mycobacterium sp. 663a-19]|uniref:SRPBCC family protein n=1 Tax=Mycobacterium sp. 663a-19 TaxID=2986148 RepID=UPI002D1E5BFE|nr:SRPBCC family protein [Mycobacterium sp. 663a-19]MEB3980065.1 SRPBCC family protein [Mycobacterium sp. 663a-19]
MANPIRCEVEIRRSPEDVFGYLVSLENETQWNQQVAECAHVSGTPATVGAQYRRTQKMMGQEMTTTVELTAVEPRKRFAFTARGGPATIKGTYDVEQVDGGSRVVAALDAGMMTTPMRPLITPQLNASLAELKRLLELDASS